ncbi:MAG: NAD(P)H-binding protein [Candidatus Latescibacterota bacterium]|nr:MAG: NAD(P)H-binding protein [Candidatus Latescibacterota bacterium]
MKVAVNTPTGNIGRGLCERLLNAGVELVLLARSPEKVEHLADRGAVVYKGDLEDADFVVNATKNIDVLFWLTPPNYATDDLRGHQNVLADIVVRAVNENNIPRVIDLSSVGAHLSEGTGPIAGLGDVERKLEQTDAQVTHLRPGFFMENYFMSAETIASQNAVFLPMEGSAKMAMIATDDIAKVAAERILDKKWSDRTVIELVGPSDVTFENAAKTIGDALGREVNHVTTTLAQTRDALTGMGVPSSTADLFLEMYGAFNSGSITLESPGSEKVGTTTFRSFAEQSFVPALTAMGDAKG